MKTIKEQVIDVLNRISLEGIIDVQFLNSLVAVRLRGLFSGDTFDNLVSYGYRINILPPDVTGKVFYEGNSIEIVVDWEESVSDTGIQTYILKKTNRLGIIEESTENENSKNETAGILF